MAYNVNDFVMSSKESGSGDSGTVEIAVHNRSQLGITSVVTTYNLIDKDGTIAEKDSRTTRDILPGEKRQILFEHRSTRNGRSRWLDITDITGTASDGTVFKVPPPARFKLKHVCFVATAVYGDADHPMVEVFRNLRDDVLVNYKAGRSFIYWYDQNGSDLASKVEHRPLLRTTVRMILTLLAITIQAIRTKINNRARPKMH
jgi:hypothetical protein